MLIIQLLVTNCFATESQDLKATLFKDQNFLYFSITNESNTLQEVNNRMSWGGGPFNEIDLIIEDENGNKYTDEYKENILAANKQTDAIEIKRNHSIGIQISIEDVKRRYFLKEGLKYNIIATYKNMFRSVPRSELISSNKITISL
ncbi:hypothetical protein [Kangiella aquimarina]|uniref:hypothetical protein n=1 Tax=Kangiella aquimarina TaxID=261965 RepID=UPI0012EA2B94|nr:hypothetical protein [Kangiella aquimarina]